MARKVSADSTGREKARSNHRRGNDDDEDPSFIWVIRRTECRPIMTSLVPVLESSADLESVGKILESTTVLFITTMVSSVASPIMGSASHLNVLIRISWVSSAGLSIHTAEESCRAVVH